MTSWSQKRPGAGKFTPEDINANLCTHVIYAFATLRDHKLAEANDKDPEMYDRVVALREKNPDLKVSIPYFVSFKIVTIVCFRFCWQSVVGPSVRLPSRN